MSQNITDTVGNIMKHKYNNINKKIYRLKNEQRNDTQHKTNILYRQIENLTNIKFTNK
jgi:hypothetical protein